MQIVSNRFRDNGAGPRSRAFCFTDVQGLVTLPDDRNRAFSRAIAPAGGTSPGLLWHDAGVASKPEVIERQGRRVALSASRMRQGAVKAPTCCPKRDVPA